MIHSKHSCPKCYSSNTSCVEWDSKCKNAKFRCECGYAWIKRIEPITILIDEEEFETLNLIVQSLFDHWEIPKDKLGIVLFNKDWVTTELMKQMTDTLTELIQQGHRTFEMRGHKT